MVAYAHSVSGAPPARWELLSDHLAEVAELAALFAAKFDAGEWGRASGLLHDVGKLSPEFQARLQGGKTPVDHSTAGARIAVDRFGGWGRLLAYAIAGHHAGLANWSGEIAFGDPTPLEQRLDARRPIPATPGWESHCSLPEQLSPFTPTARPELQGALARQGLSLALFTRMLFSALVDADRLATEAFYCKSGNRAHSR